MNTNADNAKLTVALIASTDYREFLRHYLALGGRNGKAIGYAQFSRLAGFSSRSYPREVVLGKKRISPGSLSGFLKAFKIDSEVKEYFKLLVAIEESGVAKTIGSVDEIRSKLVRVRHDLENELNRKWFYSQPHPAIEKLLRFSSAQGRVRAALSGRSRARTPKEIARIAKITEETAKAILKLYVELGPVAKEETTDRYYRKAIIGLQNLAQIPSSKPYFMNVIEEMRKQIDQFYGTPLVGIGASYALVKTSDLTKIRTEIRDAVTRILNDYTTPDGDHAVTFLRALF